VNRLTHWLIEYGVPAEGLSPQQRRRHWLRVSFVVFVALPVFLSALYYTIFAKDRYVSSAGFAVRGMDSGGGMDIVGSFTGMAGAGSTTSDSYMVLKYLHSRDLLEILMNAVDFEAIYNPTTVDLIARMGRGLTIEEKVEYWASRIDASFDLTSGIITFDVQAFTQDDAQRVGEVVLESAQALVNRLSERARQDSLRFAEDEVALAEQRLLASLQKIRTFRESEQSLNPAASAEIQVKLLGDLNKQLIEIRARMRALAESVDEDAPTMTALRRQAKALEEQIAENSQGVEMSNPEQTRDLTGLLASYENLEVEKQFAQEAYQSALASLEQARIEADRQQRYLAVYSVPSVPQEAIYPERILNIFLWLLITSTLWGIGVLIVYAVRDHLV